MPTSSEWQQKLTKSCSHEKKHMDSKILKVGYIYTANYMRNVTDKKRYNTK